MAIYNKRITFNQEKLITHYLKRNSITDYIYGIIRLIGIIIENIYCVSSYLVLSWIILLPLNWIRNDLYSKVENYLYNALLYIVSSWSLAAGATIVETGEEYKHLIEEPYNHMVCENKFISKTNTITTANDSEKSLKEQLENKKLQQQSMLGNGYHQNENAKFDDGNVKFNSKSKQSTNMGDENDVGIKSINNKSAETSEFSNQAGDQLGLKSINDLNRTNDSQEDKLGCLTLHHHNNNNDNSYINRKLEPDCTSNSKSPTTINRVLVNNHQNVNKIEAMHHRSLNPRTPKVLFLCNHISTADVPLIMQSLSTLTNQSILWVLDAQFKPTNFGLVCSSHGDFFIAKDSFKDGSLRDQALKHPDRNIFVLFPEGGFWRKRLDGSNRYALKNNLPMTRYVTHPRFGAFKDLIDPSVEITHIVDATLFYDDIKNPLSILDIALGTRKEPAILHYKVYDRSEINPTEEWLRNIWLEKDKLLQQYYEDRDSVYRKFGNTLRSSKLDWFKLLSVHLFYLLVCYLTIYRLFSATSVTMLKARDLYYSNI